MNHKLYIVSTPIGNYDDITLRALKTLKEVDLIICEEYKPTRRLLSYYEITKELFSLNEHNESDDASEAISEILSGKTAALISDAGTPLFSDPGTILVNQAIEKGIQIIPIPGASSLLSALVGSGYELNNFYYYGWLSPKKEIRRSQLQKLKSLTELLIIMETPYRLQALLSDIKRTFGNYQFVVVAFKLTQNGETFFRGTVSSVIETTSKEKNKGEFVLLLDNRKMRKGNNRSTL
ncbi:MAG: 16S rRNA (cytidine(1402)-2'-O)-methyltransferase [Melioribacteraceae bacterium]|jgi:16S rRNA (cytidine1402-2'-O)-methyltransferase|nr:16S rRNA (cytidine(1402)-2'-O)-methyltransferase [Melioribacteraceae bacterium]